MRTGFNKNKIGKIFSFQLNSLILGDYMVVRYDWMIQI